jgi:hypothetical protein
MHRQGVKAQLGTSENKNVATDAPVVPLAAPLR